MENTNCNCQENIINKVNQVQDFINKKLSDITKAECSRMNNENERIKNETARQKAESDRITNENVRKEGYNKIVEQTDKFTKSEKDRQQNELERIDNENKRQQQETDRKNAENIRKGFESSRQAAETQRATSEINRIGNESNRVIAEDRRNIAEQNRQQNELIRETQESTRQDNELIRKNQENSRVEAEAVRVTAESARVDAENARATAEDGRSDAESRRQDNESVRVTAEAARVTAETERQQGFTEKAAHLEELLQYIKDNHLEPDTKLAEAIKNTINGTDEFVYLDTNDGNVKSMPNTNKLGANVASVYYAGKRSIGLGEKCQIFSAGNTLVRNLDLSGWDFEAATSMSSFLEGASALKTLTLPDNMTLSHIDSMYSAFDGCTSLRELDTSKWTLENVTNMNNCFWGCASLKSLDMSKWTLENVTGMNNCLRDCASLKSLDMSKCTLENVTDIGQCFRGLSLLQELNLSSCNITKCRDWFSWILSDKNLETLRIGLIDFSPCGDVNFLDRTNIRVLTGTLRGIKNNFMATSNRMTRDSCMVVINGLEMVTEAKTLTLGVNNKPVSLGGKGSDPISDDDLKVATDKGWTVQFA